MTDYFVGPGGNDANSGVDWTNRKLTVSGAHALSLVGGDDVLIGPGYYPELLTLAKGGGSLYTTGTVSVTRGSAVVTGSGTTFTGNVFVNGVFQIRVLASGTDGVTTGTDATFTSAAGNFQQGHVGYVLSIATKAPYR